MRRVGCSVNIKTLKSVGTTTYPHEGAEDRREVGKGSLPSAYILVIPNNEGPLFEMLQQFLAAAAGHTAVFPLDSRKAALEGVDPRLEHEAAAEYLGVGRSTLYRYAEEEQIESRKFCGRLEYRLSTLEEFKARHVRPAHHSRRESGIILSAPRSGK
jgi:excisionase family DNA binding protein